MFSVLSVAQKYQIKYMNRPQNHIHMLFYANQNWELNFEIVQLILLKGFE